MREREREKDRESGDRQCCVISPRERVDRCMFDERRENNEVNERRRCKNGSGKKKEESGIKGIRDNYLMKVVG